MFNKADLKENTSVNVVYASVTALFLWCSYNEVLGGGLSRKQYGESHFYLYCAVVLIKNIIYLVLVC